MSDRERPVRAFPVRGANEAPARRYLEAGSPEPVQPRSASTVLLLREEPDGRAGVQVFMQSRVAAMAFAPGVTVFPGGGVDARDADPGLPVSGPDLPWWARRLGADTDTARGLLAAACREVFEECGVLLAGHRGAQGAAEGLDDLFGGSDAAVRARQALDAGEISLTELLRSLDLELRSELLTPYARWITPAYHPRRYDTFMFLARMPAGQQADGQSTETETAGWVRPADVLRDRLEGRVTMLPPTVVALERLDPASAPVDRAADWLADLQGREWNMGPVLPKLVSGPDGTPTLMAEVL